MSAPDFPLLDPSLSLSLSRLLGVSTPYFALTTPTPKPKPRPINEYLYAFLFLFKLKPTVALNLGPTKSYPSPFIDLSDVKAKLTHKPADECPRHSFPLSQPQADPECPQPSFALFKKKARPTINNTINAPKVYFALPGYA